MLRAIGRFRAYDRTRLGASQPSREESVLRGCSGCDREATRDAIGSVEERRTWDRPSEGFDARKGRILALLLDPTTFPEKKRSSTHASNRAPIRMWRRHVPDILRFASVLPYDVLLPRTSSPIPRARRTDGFSFREPYPRTVPEEESPKGGPAWE